MQQVGAQGFADAQLVDPRQLPVPIQSISRRTRLGFTKAWLLHRKLMVRAAAAGVVIVGAVGVWAGSGISSLYVTTSNGQVAVRSGNGWRMIGPGSAVTIPA